MCLDYNSFWIKNREKWRDSVQKLDTYEYIWFVDLTLETCQFYLIRMKKQSLKFEEKNLIIIAVYPLDDIPHREELLQVT